MLLLPDGSLPKFGAPIKTPIYHNPYYGDPQKGTPNFWDTTKSWLNLQDLLHQQLKSQGSSPADSGEPPPPSAVKVCQAADVWAGGLLLHRRACQSCSRSWRIWSQIFANLLFSELENWMTKAKCRHVSEAFRRCLSCMRLEG